MPFITYIKRILILFVFILPACSGLGTDNTPLPSPLVPLQAKQQVTLLWSTRVGSGLHGDYLSLQPVIAGDEMFVADKSGLIANIDVRTGRFLWKKNIKSSIISGPALATHLLIVTTEEPKLIAINAKNGNLLWQIKLVNQTLAAPKIFQDRIIVKTIDGRLLAYSIENGRLLWEYDHDTSSFSLRASSTVQIINDLVIAGFPDGKLIAVALSNGKLKWEQTITEPEGTTQVKQLIDIAADPLLRNNVIYVATYQGKIAAVDWRTGAVRWRNDISSYTGLALANQLVFITDAQGFIWAFDSKTGYLIWKQPQLQYRVLTPPTLMENKIVVADGEGYLHWLAQADAVIVARVLVKKNVGIISAPVILNDKVFVVTRDGQISAWQFGRV